MDAVGVRHLALLDQGGGAVGRAVVDHQHIKGELQAHHRLEHANHVLALVVRRDDDQAVVHDFEGTATHVVMRSMFSSSLVRWRQWPRGKSFW